MLVRIDYRTYVIDNSNNNNKVVYDYNNSSKVVPFSIVVVSLDARERIFHLFFVSPWRGEEDDDDLVAQQ